MVRAGTLMPSVHAFGVEYSRGLWLIPSYSPGTKIMFFQDRCRRKSCRGGNRLTPVGLVDNEVVFR